MRHPEAAPSGAGSPIVALPLDVTDIPSIRAAIDETIGRFGAIDALVNNAGYGLVGAFEATTSEQVERQMATNVTGLMNVTRAVLPHFRQRRAGVLVNVASMGGRLTFPFYSVYHASKWAVEGFSESLSYELQPFGVRVKIIEPGPIKTDFYDRSQDVAKQEGLTAYDGLLAKALPVMQQAGATAPGGEVVARTILRGHRRFVAAALSGQFAVVLEPSPFAGSQDVHGHRSLAGVQVGGRSGANPSPCSPARDGRAVPLPPGATDAVLADMERAYMGATVAAGGVVARMAMLAILKGVFRSEDRRDERAAVCASALP